MLFILVKSLDEVRWQCGVYGHHVFGRRSTQARSSVTAGHCTSCLPHPCGTRAASIRETLLATNSCAWHTTARCLRSPPCQMPQKPCAHRWPETLQQARRRPAEGGAGHVHAHRSGRACKRDMLRTLPDATARTQIRFRERTKPPAIPDHAIPHHAQRCGTALSHPPDEDRRSVTRRKSPTVRLIAPVGSLCGGQTPRRAPLGLFCSGWRALPAALSKKPHGESCPHARGV